MLPSGIGDFLVIFIMFVLYDTFITKMEVLNV